MRLARVGWHLAGGVAVATMVFPFVGRERCRNHVRRWSLALLRILGVRLHVTGAVPPALNLPLMLVANHVSWLDIVALNAVQPSRFVAKSEVRDWPVIGWLAVRVGTLFIRRARRRDTARINDDLVHAMRACDPVAIFPEATTTDGGTVLEFHSSLIQAAVVSGALVCPVAIRYVRADGARCTDAAYCGGKTVWETLVAVAARPGLRAELVFLPPITGAEGGRRGIARAAREVILTSLFRRAPGSPAETAGRLPAATR